MDMILEKLGESSYEAWRAGVAAEEAASNQPTLDACITIGGAEEVQADPSLKAPAFKPRY